MKRMLINATQPEELRVAMVDGQQLYDLDIEVATHGQKKASIFKGRVTRVEQSLEAAFIEYGGDRHGFLPFKEIARSYLGGGDEDGPRPSVKDVLKEGQELLVQVEKEERGNKGAALTTFISLAGRYLVLMPNNPRAGGISRRVEGDDRSELREALSTLDLPDGMGLIVRTAGVGRSAEELQWDLNYLLKLWTAIETASTEQRAPFLVYQESNVIIRAIRDYFRQDINEILIDSEEVFDQARDFMGQVMPHNLSKVKRYEDPVPLFSRYQIESQIENAFSRTVRLPSGGSVVIDHTEAMISIDINSARATKGSDIEETALNTNLEASDEIARQLRLRDVGGLIVIDYIDMSPARNQREVENRLRDALKQDRARVQVGRISRFGLLEMSRQRLRPSLGESSQIVCPRCNGRGSIRGLESLALSVLRVVEEDAMKEKTGRVLCKVPLDIGTFLLNEKRDALHRIEDQHGAHIIVVPDPDMESPHYEVERIRADDAEHGAVRTRSYELAGKTDSVPDFAKAEKSAPVAEPAVKAVERSAPVTVAEPVVENGAPIVENGAEEPGLIRKLWRSLFAAETAVETEAPAGAKVDSGAGAASSGEGGNGRGRGSSRPRSGSGQQRRRGGSGGSRGNNQRRDNDNSQRRDNDDERTENKPREASAEKRGGRSDQQRQRNQRGRQEDGQQQPTPEKEPRQEAVATTENQQPATDGDASVEEARPRSSRSGRGSRRGRRGGSRNRNRNNAAGSSTEEASGSAEGNVSRETAGTQASAPAAETGATPAPDKGRRASSAENVDHDAVTVVRNVPPSAPSSRPPETLRQQSAEAAPRSAPSVSSDGGQRGNDTPGPAASRPEPKSEATPRPAPVESAPRPAAAESAPRPAAAESAPRPAAAESAPRLAAAESAPRPAAAESAPRPTAAESAPRVASPPAQSATKPPEATGE